MTDKKLLLPSILTDVDQTMNSSRGSSPQSRRSSMLLESPQTPLSCTTWDSSPLANTSNDYEACHYFSPLIRKKLIDDLTPDETQTAVTSAGLEAKQLQPLNINQDIQLCKETLGKGAFHRVVKAVSLKTSKFYAVKMPLHQQEYSLSQLRHEAMILSHIGCHPNIIRSYGLLKNGVGLVLDLQDQTMVDYIANLAHHPDDNTCVPVVGKLMWLQWTLRLCSALDFLKTKNVVHCDLKTDNILVSNPSSAHPNVIIADFSSAHTVDELTRDSLHISNTAFSFEFCAPELLSNPDLAPSFSTDLYSLGLILLHVATGNEPYHRAVKSFTQKLIWAKQGAALKSCSPQDINRLSSIIQIIHCFLSTRTGLDQIISQVTQMLNTMNT